MDIIKDLKEITGFITENELDELISSSENVVGGTGSVCDTISITVGVITMTLGMDFCPTSACTKAC